VRNAQEMLSRHSLHISICRYTVTCPKQFPRSSNLNVHVACKLISRPPRRSNVKLQSIPVLWHLIAIDSQTDFCSSQLPVPIHSQVLSPSVRADSAPGRYGGRLPSSGIRLYEYGVEVGAGLPALRSASLLLLAVDGLVIVDLHY
jgi:hypothetical protein